ncbi:hypothetical protein BGZ57DRAFT_870863 [Hyaloscypha finlandica]|nr:hypothetical protein BGZ57DRAFT_870863 [Hyaloscypha finlandica]
MQSTDIPDWRNHQHHPSTSEHPFPEPPARPTLLRTDVQMQGIDPTRRGISSETAASDLVQATVDLGQHVVDNLETVVQTFRVDLEHLYQQAQRLHEAVRCEQNEDQATRQHLDPARRSQEQRQENSSAAHSHPIQIVQEPLERLHFTLVPERIREGRLYPQVQPMSEDPESEDGREEEPRLHLRGGAGDDSDTPEESDSAEEAASPEEPGTTEGLVASGEPMTMDEFDNRIGADARFGYRPTC